MGGAGILQQDHRLQHPLYPLHWFRFSLGWYLQPHRPRPATIIAGAARPATPRGLGPHPIRNAPACAPLVLVGVVYIGLVCTTPNPTVHTRPAHAHLRPQPPAGVRVHSCRRQPRQRGNAHQHLPHQHAEAVVPGIGRGGRDPTSIGAHGPQWHAEVWVTNSVPTVPCPRPHL